MKNVELKIMNELRKVIYLVLASLDRVLRRKTLITIFCYHSIAQDTNIVGPP